MEPKRVIISRTDAIGDVILTLPVASALKELYPKCHVIFLGKSYTHSVLEASPFVDQILDFEDLLKLTKAEQIQMLRSLGADTFIHVFPNAYLAKLAKLAQIPLRIGTRQRWFHWLTCNYRVALSRKNSSLHEAQLNLKLLRPIGGKDSYPLDTIRAMTRLSPRSAAINLDGLDFDSKKFNLIIHPRSKGSAREWGLDHFVRLVELLPKDRFRIFVSGTKEEGEGMKGHRLLALSQVQDLTGRFSLKEFVAFIQRCDGLIAASTGPLHIAAGLGIHALGLYPPIQPMHPGRWAPLGPKAEFLVIDNPGCETCRKDSRLCACMGAITPEAVASRLSRWV